MGWEGKKKKKGERVKGKKKIPRQEYQSNVLLIFIGFNGIKKYAPSFYRVSKREKWGSRWVSFYIKKDIYLKKKFFFLARFKFQKGANAFLFFFFLLIFFPPEILRFMHYYTCEKDMSFPKNHSWIKKNWITCRGNSFNI